MSLVNDALKKARMEAARGDAAKSGIPYPALGRGQHPSSGPWLPVLLAVLLLGVGLGGLFLYRAGRQSALSAGTEELPALANAASAARSNGESETTPSESSVGLADQARPPVERAATSTIAPTRSAEPAPTRSAEPESRRLSETVPLRRDQPASTPAAVQTADSPEPQPAATPTASRSEAPELERRSVNQPSSQPERQVTPAAEPAPATEYLRSADIAGVGPIELGGIAWSGDRPFALLNGRVVRPGDSVLGLQIEEIQPNTVRLRGKAGDIVLKLK